MAHPFSFLVYTNPSLYLCERSSTVQSQQCVSQDRVVLATCYWRYRAQTLLLNSSGRNFPRLLGDGSLSTIVHPGWLMHVLTLNLNELTNPWDAQEEE